MITLLIALGALFLGHSAYSLEAVNIIGTSASLFNACIQDVTVEQKVFTANLANYSINVLQNAEYTWTLKLINSNESSSSTTDPINSTLVDFKVGRVNRYTVEAYLPAGVYSLRFKIEIQDGSDWDSTGYFISTCFPFDELNETCNLTMGQLTSLNISLTGLGNRRCVETPLLEIKCLRNCGTFVHPKRHLEFKTVCSNCQFLFDSFIWTVYRCTNPPDDGRPCIGDYLKDQETLVRKESDSLIVQAYMMLPNTAYIIKLYAFILVGNIRLSAHYGWTTGITPWLSSCAMYPPSGYERLTEFTIDCENHRKDLDMWLQLELYQNTIHGYSKVQMSASLPFRNVKLSRGNGDHNWRKSILIKISTSSKLVSLIGFPENIFITGKVQPFPVKDTIDDLVNSPDEPAVVSMLIELAEYLNNDAEEEDTTQEMKTKMRTSTIKVLETVTVTSVTSVGQVINGLNSATQVSTELSTEAQEMASSTYSNLANSMQNFASSANQNNLQDAAGSILQGVSQLLIVQLQSEEESDSVEQEDKAEKVIAKEKVKQSACKILRTIQVVTDTLLDAAMPGMPPVILASNHLATRVEKKYLSTLSKAELNQNLVGHDGKIISASFTLPELSNTGNASVVGIEMLLMDTNPYIWDESGDDICTPVLTVSFKNEQKENVAVADTDHPISFTLPLKDVGQSQNVNFTTHLTSISSKVGYKPSEVNTLILNLTSPNHQEFGTYTPLLKILLQSHNLPVIIYLSRNVVPTCSDIVKYGSKLSEIESGLWGYITASNSNRTSTPSTDDDSLILQLSNNETHYLGIVLDLEVEDDFMCQYLNTSRLNGRYGCVSDEFTLKQIETTLDVYMTEVACMFWDEELDKWSMEGCMIEPSTTFTTLHCTCTHMTVFAGGAFLIKPNLVNALTNAYLFLTFFDNPVVPTTVVIVWIVYFLLLKWGLKKDADDQQKNYVMMCSGNRESHTYSYLLCFITGWWRGSGTTASVYFYLTGNKGQSHRQSLNTSSSWLCFHTGSEDWFLLRTPASLGKIESITVWHDNTGTSPEWYLSQVYVMDLEEDSSWNCIYNDWMCAGLVSKKSLRATISAHSNQKFEENRQEHVKMKFRRDIQEEHLWFSIFSKQPGSHFTRCQRITCGLSFVLTEMLGNIMFHGIPKDHPEDQHTVFDFHTISLSALVMGIEMSIFVFPINFTLIKLFSSAAAASHSSTKTSSSQRKTQHYLEHLHSFADNLRVHLQKEGEIDDPDKWYDAQSKVSITNNTTSLSEIVVYSEQDDWHVAEEDIQIVQDNRQSVAKPTNFDLSPQRRMSNIIKAQKKHQSFCLPSWSVYIAWVWAAVTCTTCSYFVMLYGLKYGYTKSIEWLISFISGFLTGIIFTQTMFVAVIAIFSTVIVKRSVDLIESCPDEVLDEDEAFVFGINESTFSSQFFVAPYSKKDVVMLRWRKFLNWLSKYTVYSVLMYLAFGLLLLVVIHGDTDITGTYQSTRAIETLLVRKQNCSQNITEFYEVTDFNSFFLFMKYKLAPIMSELSSPDIDLKDRAIPHLLLGPYRIRQQRVKEESCSADLHFVLKVLSDRPACFDDYYVDVTDTDNFTEGWKPVTEEPSSVTRWSYQTSSDLGSSSLTGKLTTYFGGGYAQEIPGNLDKQIDILNQIQTDDWLDRKTRVVFVEFTLYNSNANLYSVVTLFFEVTSIGKIFPYHQVLIGKLKAYEPLLTFFHSLLFIFIFGFIVSEIKRAKKLERKMYLKDPWNVFEVIQLILSFSVVVIFYQKDIAIKRAINSYMSSEKDTYISFFQALEWTYTLRYLMSFLLSLIIVRLLKIGQFFKTTFLIMDLFALSAGTVFGLMFTVSVIALASSHFTHLVFGRSVYGYRSYWSSITSLFKMFVHNSFFDEMVLVNKALGYAYFLVFVVVVKWCFLTLFTVVIMYGRSFVKVNQHRREMQYSLIQQILQILGEKLVTTLRYK